MAKADKDEVVYAIVRVGGKQHKVATGDLIEVDRVATAEGKSLTLEPLAVRTTDGVFDALAHLIEARADLAFETLRVGRIGTGQGLGA